MTGQSERHSIFLLAARQSPDFAARWLARLGAGERAELVRRWCTLSPAPAPAETRAPRLRKCVPSAATELGAQLEAFARSVRRVG